MLVKVAAKVVIISDICKFLGEKVCILWKIRRIPKKKNKSPGPDGYLHFPPIVNWVKYREENGRLMMPVTIRLNHAVADGFLVANVFRLLGKETALFVKGDCGKEN